MIKFKLSHVPTLSILVLLAGCRNISSSGGNTGPVNPDLTGNWQITFAPTAGPALFPNASGFLMESITDSSSTKEVSAELRAVGASGCFFGVNPLFGTGQVAGTDLGIKTASTDGQYIQLSGTLNATSDQFTGSYNVSGGCASGDAGTVSGQRYTALTGTYSGPIASTPMQTLSFDLLQNGLGNGNGQFVVTGTLNATGFSCFQTGTMGAADGDVSGNSFNLTFATNDASGANLSVAGTFDPAASTLTLDSVSVDKGVCAGSYGSATLTK